MWVKKLIFCSILLTICHTINAEYDVNAYCTLVGNGIKLASIDNCGTYYTCQNGKATQGTCPSAQAFDKDAQGCRPKSDVQCYIGNDQPCQLKSEGFVPVSGTCNQYIYCKNYAEFGRGTCPNNQIFHQGSCVYGNCNDNINQGNTNTGLNSVCEIMPDTIFFGSSKDCKIWQKCTKGSLKAESCPKDYVFDVQLQKCNFESGNMCSRVTGQDIQPDPSPTRPCTSLQNGNIDPDSATCSVYYVCDGTKWDRRSCSSGYFFSVQTNQCVIRQKATPIDTCNRCENSKKQFVNAVDPNCRGYQTCVNGVKTSEIKYCPANSYFDELSQACILDKDGKADYALKNGACFNCDDQCQALSKEKCSPTSNGCSCAIDEDDECIACSGTITNGKCTEDANCDAKCEPLIGAECVPVDDCQCGLDDSDKCTVCSSAPVGGKCENQNPPGDCATKCKAASPCEDVDTCTCDINDGECSDCSAGNCNGCVCAGSGCPDGETCTCFDNAGTCEICTNGVDETGCIPE